jgi:Ca-activated chloride channel family protein
MHGMTRWRRQLAVCLLSTIGVTFTFTTGVNTQTAGGRNSPRTRFDVVADTVALNVVVTTSDGHVNDLQAADFVVRDNGRPQPVTIFGHADVPLDLLLLIDTSGSVGPHLDLLRIAARTLFQTLRPNDRAAVMGFDKRVNVLADWTSDRQVLERAVNSIGADGETALFAAIFVGLRKIASSVDLDVGWRRRAIVVLSDGVDTSSRLSYDDVLDACRRSSTLIYTVRVEDPFPAYLRYSTVGDGGQPEFVMTTLARETGAQAFAMRNASELPRLFMQIAVELRNQYLLGYATPVEAFRGPEFRLVDVAVPRITGARARTKRGYYSSPGLRLTAPRSAPAALPRSGRPSNQTKVP